MGIEDWDIEISIRSKKDSTKWSKLTTGGSGLPADKVLIPSMVVELKRIIKDYEEKNGT